MVTALLTNNLSRGSDRRPRIGAAPSAWSGLLTRLATKGRDKFGLTYQFERAAEKWLEFQHATTRLRFAYRRFSLRAAAA